MSGRRICCCGDDQAVHVVLKQPDTLGVFHDGGCTKCRCAGFSLCHVEVTCVDCGKVQPCEYEHGEDKVTIRWRDPGEEEHEIPKGFQIGQRVRSKKRNRDREGSVGEVRQIRNSKTGCAVLFDGDDALEDHDWDELELVEIVAGEEE